MPITEQDLTELTAALQAGNYGENPNVQALAKMGFKIRTEQEETGFLENYANTKKSEVVSELATNLEKDILEVTGIEKKPNEKYYDYLKRATGGIKSELDTLKAAKTGTEADRARIAELQELLNAKDQEKENALNEVTGKFAQKEISNAVNGAIGAIKATFKKLEGNLLDDVVDSRRRKFLETYTPEYTQDGTVIFKDKDGKTVNGKDYRPATADTLVKEFFADLVDGGKQQQGTGSGKQEQGQGATGSDPGTPPADVRTRGDLVTWLKNTAKLKPDSKDFNDAFTKYGKDLPLR